MTEYIEDAGLSDALTAILGDVTLAEFKPLRDNDIKIIPLLKVKTNKEGEHTPCTGSPAQVKKVSDLHRAAGINAHYLLVVDYYAWNHPKGINPQLVMDAMLHSALKSIKVEVKDDKPKFGKNDPDVVAYVDTVKRYPGYDETLVEVSRLALAAPVEAKKLADGDVDGASEHITSHEEQPVEKAPRRGKK